MARVKSEPVTRSVELMEKLVLVQLHALGTPQSVIARFLGKASSWVNQNLKGVPKPTKE
jgi:hypothetical protein